VIKDVFSQNGHYLSFPVVAVITVRTTTIGNLRADTDSRYGTSGSDAEFAGSAHEVQLGSHAQLGVHVRQVGLDGAFADEKLIRDLPGHIAFGRELGHLAFAPAEGAGADQFGLLATPSRTHAGDGGENLVAAHGGVTFLEPGGRSLEGLQGSGALDSGQRQTQQGQGPTLEQPPAGGAKLS